MPGPDAVAAAIVWRKLNPGKVLEAKLDDLYDLQMDFEENNGEDEAPRAAARLLAGVAVDGLFEADAAQIPFAEAWAAGNVERYADAMEDVGEELAMEFWDQFAEDGDPEDADVVRRVAVKSVRSQKDPRTPARFFAAGRAWKGRNRSAYLDAEAEVALELLAEDEAKQREVARLELEMAEKESVLRLRARARAVRAGAARAKDKDSAAEIKRAMEDEATADSAALTEFNENHVTKILDLLRWRVATHERIRDEARADFDTESADRSYLVVLKKVRPTDKQKMLDDQKALHDRKVDVHHANVASQNALLADLERLVATYTPPEPAFDEDGNAVDEFGNKIEPKDDPTAVDESTAAAIADGEKAAAEANAEPTEAEAILATGEHLGGGDLGQNRRSLQDLPEPSEDLLSFSEDKADVKDDDNFDDNDY